MFPHYKFYVREVKIKAYAQLLESYRSLTLGYMADAFGVTEDYIDSELCRFIAGGRLHAKIDKVSYQNKSNLNFFHFQLNEDQIKNLFPNICLHYCFIIRLGELL